MGFNPNDYDFAGYATMNDILCSDGRIIKRDAFKAQDGSRIPLLWNHDHQNISDVSGHADLENRSDGVYAYCKLNTHRQNDCMHIANLITAKTPRWQRRLSSMVIFHHFLFMQTSLNRWATKSCMALSEN